MRSGFRHADAVRLANSLANPAHVYFATDAVTGALVIRVSGRLTEEQQSKVENALSRFARKWARTGAVFSRKRHGETSFLPVGLERHAEPLTGLFDPSR